MTRTIAALLVLLCAVPAQAVSIPAPVENEISNARLAGQGSFRWFGFKIYDAQLWVGDRGYQADSPESAKFALSLTYARDLSGNPGLVKQRLQLDEQRFRQGLAEPGVRTARR